MLNCLLYEDITFNQPRGYNIYLLGFVVSSKKTRRSTMSTLNRVTLIGRLGQEPEVKTTEKGLKIANFSIATNGGSKDNPTTTWHRLTVFDKSANFVEEYYHKGDLVLVEGELENRSYNDKDGNKKYQFQVKVRRTQILSSSKSTNNSDNIPSMADLESTDTRNW
jgi:single-strand DNA-binding protein